MSNETNESPQTSSEGAGETNEAPRAKTPLEMVRERQAKMRGQLNATRRGSGETDHTGPAESYKRRMRQRKSG